MGTWGEVTTRKNEHQSNWAFGANRYMGQMDIWGKGHLRAKGRFGTNEHGDKWTFGKTSSLEQMGK